MGWLGIIVSDDHDCVRWIDVGFVIVAIWNLGGWLLGCLVDWLGIIFSKVEG